VGSNGSEVGNGDFKNGRLSNGDAVIGAQVDAAPLIGLSAYCERAAHGVWDHDAVLLPRAYSDMVIAAGGIPVVLPPRVEATAAVDRIDALLLSGGPDVAPERYGAARDPRTGPARPERDAAEIAMLRRALQRRIPVLGVCRGMQVLNVALGGTLVQHLPDAVGHEGHRPAPGVFGTITVTLDPASRTGAAVGASVAVRCHHHHALGRLADGLVPVGAAKDGTVEAVELAGYPFVVGVQWHPEQDSTELELMSAFVAAAAAEPATTG
jgi:putative glutamine amidotransferase